MSECVELGARGACDIEALSDPVCGGAVGLVWPQGDGVVGDALALEIRRAGKRMEAAMEAGQRSLAVVWMRCMYGLIAERARMGGGVQAGGRNGADQND